MRRNTRMVLLAALGMSIAACGGGGGGSSGGGGGGTVPITNAAVGGLWFGTISPINETADEVIGVIAENGRAYFLDEWDQMYWGTVSSSGNAITGRFTMADIYGYSLWDESYSAAVTLAGTVQSRSTLGGNWELTTTNKSYKSGKLALEYDPLYDEDSSLAKIAGNYWDVSSFSEDVINIAANGDIFAQLSYGSCVINGQVSIINPTYNAYDVQYRYNGCATDDSYYGAQFRGLAFYIPADEMLIVFAHRLNVTEPEPVVWLLMIR